MRSRPWLCIRCFNGAPDRNPGKEFVPSLRSSGESVLEPQMGIRGRSDASDAAAHVHSEVSMEPQIGIREGTSASGGDGETESFNGAPDRNPGKETKWFNF